MGSLRKDLEKLYEEQEGRLFVCALAITRCPAAAEDAVHDAFRRLLSLDRRPRDVKTYAFQCVRNAAIDIRRRDGLENFADNWRTMMDSFERRLKNLPLAKPSAGLRQRIFAEPARPAVRPALWHRRSGLGWAAVLALALGAAGFVLGQYSDRPASGGPHYASIEVRIVEAASSRHDFDLTATPVEFLGGDVSVRIEAQEEI
jgi:hypothetical protein